MHKPYFQNILSQFEGVAPVVAPEQEPETKVFEMQVEQVVQVLTASSILGKFFTMSMEFEKKTTFQYDAKIALIKVEKILKGSLD